MELTADFTSLSRRFAKQWDEAVFPFTEGEPVCVDVQEIQSLKKAILPPLPKARQNTVEHLKAKNKEALSQNLGR